MWFGTDGAGITVGRIHFQTPDLADNRVRALMQDKQGRIGAGTLGGVSIYENSGWRHFSMPPELTGFPVMAILQDSKGNYWFGAEGGGVGRYDGSTWRIFTAANGLVDDGVWSIAEDNGGNLWIGTGSGGVSRFDGREWVTFTQVTDFEGTNDTTIYDAVHSIYEDRYGNLWFTSHGGGLIRYDGRHWKTFTTANGLGADYVFDVFVDSRATIWALTQRGLFKSNGLNFERFVANDYLVGVILEDKAGNLWFGTDRGAVKYDGKTKTVVLEDEGIRAIFQDTQGNIWFGTSNGVSKFDGSSWKSYTMSDGLGGNYINAILQDDRGMMWFGTDNGLSKFDGITWITQTTSDGLPDDTVYALWQDRRGDIWLGTGDGPVRHQLDRVPPKMRIIAGPEEGSTVEDNNIVFAFESGDLVTPKEELLFSVWPDPKRPWPEAPNPDDATQWSPYSSATTASYSKVPNGEQTFRVRVKDKDLNVVTVSREFAVNAVSPIALISNPVEKQVVSGRYVITGIATDTDFREYRLEISRAERGVVFSHLSSQPVEEKVLAEWDTRTVADGDYVIVLYATDTKGNESRAERTVIVDNTPPDAQITLPANGAQVNTPVELRGTATDANFQEYTVEFGEGAQPTIWTLASTPEDATRKGEVKNGTLFQWQPKVKEGEFTLRVTVLDPVGHQKAATVTVRLLLPLTKDEGGPARSSDGVASLSIPPRSLPSDTIVTINRVPTAEIQPPPDRVQSLDLAYDIGPVDLRLREIKPATLQLQLHRPAAQGKRIAVFRWEGEGPPEQKPSTGKWKFLGGTVQEGKAIIGIKEFGRYALMEVDITDDLSAETFWFTCQPRLFSATGGETTTIVFSLQKEASVTLLIYNLDGRLQRTLVSGDRLYAGRNAVLWDGRDESGRVVPSSLYLIALSIDDQKVETKTVVVQNR